jgi:hypothetical protein
MYTIEDLRREMAEETEGLGSQVTFKQVKVGAVRRGLRTVVGVVVGALVPVLAAGTFTAVQTTGSGPTLAPTPAPTGTVTPDRSFDPPSGPIVSTGLHVGTDEELVLYYRDAVNGVRAALSGPRGVRDLDGGSLARPGQFDTIYEIDDRHGGIIDYGAFGRADARVEATVNGTTTRASTGYLPQAPDATLFWVKRDGALTAPTGVPGNPSGAVFTARDPAGSVIGTATHIQRSDGAVNINDRPVAPIGDRISTGLTLASGGELVFWFDGDQTTAMLHAGSASGGATTKVKDLGDYRRPPFAIGFYVAANVFELAGGTKVTVGTYVGPAATVTMQGTNAGHPGSGRWTAHQEMRIFWAVGITGTPTGVATDAQGTVLGTTDFRKAGGS